ncbi:hypothetical protein H7J86_09680 [Mycobacterium hackensackense]|uniref:hypothetical protein n=1 Tax=Mycobacterium hackensackense TaxID=228909 RepID=UPI002265B5FC|nr:hypothetical protein [Mycobacterium hackensackense]MCV7252431.1 hypothetical protein [Mycobacterium hackensackense]
MASDDALSAAARSANIPTDPVAGWDLPTTDGRRVQLVLPAGLGAGETTADGQVVYPDRGAGFSVIAENKGAGGRTITRIPGPATNASGAATADGQALPTVPMFLRTPADTVMLAHTDGTITVNQATPAATTIATIAAPQARDSHGTLVPSAFVTQRIRPGLYLLAQVIHPDAATVWPVYVDPCISGCDAFTHASTSGANGAALQAAGSALVTGIKNNPVESAEIIGGGALVVTGVGSGLGASLVLSGTTGLVQKAAAADPTNQLLGAAGDALEVTNYISPARSIQKGVTAAVERGAQKFGDDVAEGALRDATVVKPVTPTPSPQLANDIAGAVTPKPGVGTPAAANAPPHERPNPPLRTDLPDAGRTASTPKDYVPETLDPGCKLDCGYTTKAPAGVYDEVEMPGHTQHKFETIPGQLTHEFPKNIPTNRRLNTRKIEPQTGKVRDESPPASVQESRNGRSSVRHLDEIESAKERKLLQALTQRHGLKGGDPQEFAYRGTDGKTRCGPCAQERYNDQQQRLSSPSDQRVEQQTHAQDTANLHRNNALNTARQGSNQTGADRDSDTSGKKKTNDKKKKKKSKINHKKP